MITERSAGAVVFTRTSDGIKYVIIESINGVKGFPKGHIERGESETQAALREVLEETGLHVSLIEGFRMEDGYTFDFKGEKRKKRVVYFLASFSGEAPTPQPSEIRSIELLNYESALSALKFKGAKTILSRADSFLQA
ncbi:MAG: NUDIX domain-containing protein [Clostridia bacterium]|nr:NUDIX domain-containing protein [Clostridia bacterium]